MEIGIRSRNEVGAKRRHKRIPAKNSRIQKVFPRSAWLDRLARNSVDGGKIIYLKIIIFGLLAGAVSKAQLGALFMSPFVHSVLYNPEIQSRLFIDITPTRDFPLSVIGLIVLSVIHAWLFYILMSAVPGKAWVKKGLFWGFVIWLMYWVFQEWFIYHTLLLEPIVPNLFELAILLAGSLVVGANAVIGFRFDATEIAGGVTEVLAYGTAVVVE